MHQLEVELRSGSVQKIHLLNRLIQEVGLHEIQKFWIIQRQMTFF